jgi:hypothetical protein
MSKEQSKHAPPESIWSLNASSIFQILLHRKFKSATWVSCAIQSFQSTRRHQPACRGLKPTEHPADNGRCVMFTEPRRSWCWILHPPVGSSRSWSHAAMLHSLPVGSEWALPLKSLWGHDSRALDHVWEQKNRDGTTESGASVTQNEKVHIM